MSASINESQVEDAALAWFAELGYSVIWGNDISPEGSTPERSSNGEVILLQRLTTAFNRLNPHLSPEIFEEVLRKLQQTETPQLLLENRRIHRYLVEGMEVEITRTDGSIGGDRAYLIDFQNPSANDWLAVRQLTVIEHGHKRRPDIVLYCNGLPLVVLELKNPGVASASLEAAYNQLQTYKTEISSLFRTNLALITSDGLLARIGSLSANLERFMPWRTIDGQNIAPKGSPELETMLRGVCDPHYLLRLLHDFTLFGDTDSGPIKILAGYHQFHAVQHAVSATIRALPQEVDVDAVMDAPGTYRTRSQNDGGDKRIGVIWHTQGSGKSLLMAFYAGQVISHPALANPTLVVVTDRNDLDDQLFKTFVMCRELLRQTPQQADSREDLQKLLNRASGGVIFTTIQKFSPEQGETDYPALTKRTNVVVIADEAHRSQYGFRAKMDRKSGKMTYGFAKYLRDALPNASFIGFTGTPIEQDDVNTPAVFGDYIDVYDINRGVEDGATVPIYYESRLARIELNEEEMLQIEDEIEDLTEDEVQEEQEKLKRKWASVEAIVGSTKRLEMVAADIVQHFEDRQNALEGKGMVVCMSRRICIALYEEIIKLRPDWHSDHPDEGAVKIVMTGSASDPQSWQPHIGDKTYRDRLAKRIKDPSDSLRIVLVRDMWLTGFDAPSMHTMYVDKPMRGHGLMQAIARVNRVFRDKPAGLIVDYIGIAQNLKTALGQYSRRDQEHTGIDESEAVAVLQEKLEIVRAMFHGFDYRSNLGGTPEERLTVLAGALQWILDWQQRQAEKASSEEEKKRAHRRFSDAVLALSKAFALASASDEARHVREEVGFFQTLRVAMVKSGSTSRISSAARDLAVQQIVSRAVVSTEIVDILRAAGMTAPDISILSDDFLNEVQGMQQRNLAMEALHKLINGEIRSPQQTNVTRVKEFTQRLEEAVARYHTNALTTAEVIQELINLAKDMKEERIRVKDLDPEEIAFYDALAENESAVEVLGNKQLGVIANELLRSLKTNAPVDWKYHATTRARMRVLVKRILRKYGFPPDLQDSAVQNVLQQAEVLAERWAA